MSNKLAYSIPDFILHTILYNMDILISFFTVLLTLQEKEHSKFHISSSSIWVSILRISPKSILLGIRENDSENNRYYNK